MRKLHKKYAVICLLAGLVFVLGISCSHSEKNPDKKTSKGVNDSVQVVDSDNKGTSNDITQTVPTGDEPETPKGEAKKDDASAVTPDVKNPDEVQSTDGSNTDDLTDHEDDEQKPDNKETENSKHPNDVSSREEIRELTFLKWIPSFEGGRYIGHDAADTFDYAHFDGTTKDEVLRYIEELQENGFTYEVDTRESGDSIEYVASNYDSWSTYVSYADGTVTIGSGFFEKEISEEVSVFDSTMLAYLPVFEEGIIESCGQDTNEADYVVFTDVEAGSVRKYLDEVKLLGFTVDVDEGDSDGIIWFYGMNSEYTFCDITYYDRVMKISCGKG